MDAIESLVRSRRFLAARPLILSQCSANDAPMWLAAVDALQFGAREPRRALGLADASSLNVQSIRQAYKCVQCS